MTLEHLARRYREALPNPSKVDAQARARFLASADAEPRRWTRWPVVAMAALVVAGVITGVVLQPEQLQFRLGEGQFQSAAGVTLSASALMPVSFSDGSTFALEQGALAHLDSLDPRRPVLTLEGGAAQVAVKHHDGRVWLVRAGQWTVEVVGTRFRTAWTPSTQGLDLSMQEGLVRVSGRDGQAWLLSGGHRLIATGDLVVVDPVEASPVVEPVEAPRVVEPVETPRVAPDAGVVGLGRVVDWRALARAGRFAEANRVATGLGLERLRTTAAAPVLLELGDVQRLSDDTTGADATYTRLRSRFPRTRQASEAAFHLGRMAFDATRWAAAEAWSSTAYDEDVTGPFALEALGLALDSAVRAGQPAAAKLHAQRYLARTPDGPRAALARRILGAP